MKQQPTFNDMSTFDIFLKNDKPSKQRGDVQTIKKAKSILANNNKSHIKYY